MYCICIYESVLSVCTFWPFKCMYSKWLWKAVNNKVTYNMYDRYMYVCIVGICMLYIVCVLYGWFVSVNSHDTRSQVVVALSTPSSSSHIPRCSPFTSWHR